jgi:hypothetical protein
MRHFFIFCLPFFFLRNFFFVQKKSKMSCNQHCPCFLAVQSMVQSLMSNSRESNNSSLLAIKALMDVFSAHLNTHQQPPQRYPHRQYNRNVQRRDNNNFNRRHPRSRSRSRSRSPDTPKGSPSNRIPTTYEDVSSVSKEDK